MRVYIENTKFWNHISYTFETIFRCMNHKKCEFIEAGNFINNEMSIYYGKQMPIQFRGIFIKEGDFFNDNYLKKESLPVFPVKRFRDIPIFFMDSSGSEPGIFEEGDYTEFNFDFIQSTFFILTGCEEIINEVEAFDLHSRYYVEQRMLCRENFLDKPLINIYASFLKEYMFRRGIIEKDSNGKESYAFISHDIDYPYGKIGIKRIIKKLPGMHLREKVDEGCRMIIQTERKYGIRSTWFVKSGGNNLEYDQHYELQNKEIQGLIEHIYTKGDEIGWHYSYNSAFDEIQLKKEYNYYMDAMKKKPLFVRGHYLRYKIPETWRAISKMGIVYDTTLGAEQREGFIFGICTPFQLFDAVKGENLLVWEIPLIVMDVTVCMDECRGYGQEEMIKQVLALIEEVKKHNGVFSLLWHNTSIRRKGWYKWEGIYLELMKVLKENFICETGENIINIYKNI